MLWSLRSLGGGTVIEHGGVRLPSRCVGGRLGVAAGASGGALAAFPQYVLTHAAWSTGHGAAPLSWVFFGLGAVRRVG